MPLNYLDLFAGAGGLSEGFIKAGFHPVAHIEMDRAACFTLKTRSAYYWLKQHGQENVYDDYLNGRITREEFYAHVPLEVLNSVLQRTMDENNLDEIFERIDELRDGEPIDLIIGGPPCQAYSLVGRARDEHGMIGDSRNYLYRLYARFLEKYQPRYFVFENVLGLLSAKESNGDKHFDLMRETFSACGYTTETKVLNARSYGVLQNRKRLILIGKLGGSEGFYPKIEQMPTDQYLVKEIFDDLPPLQAGGGVPTPVKTKPYHGTYLYRAGIRDPGDRYEMVSQHYARPTNAHDKAIYHIAVEQWNHSKKRLMYTDLPDYMRTHKNLDSFLDRFKVVAADLSYSQTVVAHLAKDGHYYIHPDIRQNRSITPREAARLQTFPDNYYFESVSGRPSRTYAFKQIGNAVPVNLAFSIAKAIRECFIHPGDYPKETEGIIHFKP